MKSRIYRGKYAIVLTPFKENGEVDYKALEKYLKRAVQSGKISGLVACGSTGEFTRLSFEENIGIMECIKDNLGDGMQLICGATASDSYTSNKYVERISKLGADGILLAPPYYFKLSDDEIIAFYDDVFKNNSANMPIIGYNIPQCTNRVSAGVFRKLLNYECFKGYKNSWNDLQEITEEICMRDAVRPDVSMFTGLDACLYATLSIGGDGLFTAITYLMPEVIDCVYTNCGVDNEKALKVQGKLFKLINTVNRFSFPLGYRILSDAIGEPLGYGREAIDRYTVSNLEQIKQEMKSEYMGIISEL